jgi:hypothetical protein
MHGSALNYGKHQQKLPYMQIPFYLLPYKNAITRRVSSSKYHSPTHLMNDRWKATDESLHSTHSDLGIAPTDSPLLHPSVVTY